MEPVRPLRGVKARVVRHVGFDDFLCEQVFRLDQHAAPQCMGGDENKGFDLHRRRCHRYDRSGRQQHPRNRTATDDADGE
jgi:hypothetical protein